MQSDKTRERITSTTFLMFHMNSLSLARINCIDVSRKFAEDNVSHLNRI